MKTTSAVFVLIASFFLNPIRAYSQQSKPKLVALSPSAAPTSQARIRVQRFQFTGNTVMSDAELGELVAAHQGHEMTLAELQTVADSVADHYHKKGFLLAKVVLPEQDITDGVVSLRVLEGKLGQITITGNERYSEGFIRKGFSRVERQKVIRQDTLERSLLLLNDNPGVRVTSVLQPGTEPGTTDIAVKVEEQDRITGTLEFNNFGSRFASRERFSPGVDFANLTGNGDTLGLRVVTGTDPSELFYGRMGYSIPLNADGTRLSTYFLGGKFEVGREFSVLNINGSGISFGLSATHPLYKSRAKSLTLEAGFDWKDSDLEFLGVTSSSDKIRSLRAGIHWNAVDSSGRNLASLFVSQGLGDALGGMSNNDPLASRLGADNRFTKFSLDAARVHRLNSKVFVIFRGAGQISTRSLVVGEQMSIGGADSVRGYPQSEFLGDNGYQLGLEGRISISERHPDRFQVAIFADHGFISVKRPVAGQSKNQDITGVGIGFRSNLPHDISLRADLGFAVGQRPTSGGTAIPYFQVIKKF